MSHQQYDACIEACVRCAQACEHCADACLDESRVKKMVDCIRSDRDCAALCWTAAGMMSRGSQLVQGICGLCADACEKCASDCEQHDMDHCQQCASECRKCAEECRQAAGVAA